MNFENILPKDGPAIEEISKYIEKYKDDIIVVKIGGSVLLNEILFDQLIVEFPHFYFIPYLTMIK